MQYTLGETVVAVSDNVKGEVVYVSANTFSVNWLDGNGVVQYPTETESVRKLWPWENETITIKHDPKLDTGGIDPTAKWGE